ncbi:helix-turn-helix domain-containing protein [Micromonospora endophytica]|uniref:Helix-turn-helix domain-containing protein n=1 Tax=Micromonospora endophytica TaxID=515350 RepID=A0A2W2CRR9_9ACTN|nr:helix-turn-helix transcriptional regulator [Micromonospora endophytica]PZF91009.1 hypothetical protein C1I93_22140 [Micromonospora endophytica]RIW41307.1 XRE family transcriptional regulator [Micromonospora endophytica]
MSEKHPSDTAYPKQLGSFLRAHRQLLTPQQVGLPPTGRRRIPGLRREEVAALSGVGLAWYTWLEQGRVVVSKRVLDAIAMLLPPQRRKLMWCMVGDPAIRAGLTDWAAVARDPGRP